MEQTVNTEIMAIGKPFIEVISNYNSITEFTLINFVL